MQFQAEEVTQAEETAQCGCSGGTTGAYLTDGKENFRQNDSPYHHGKAIGDSPE